jgi:hypothetical protein
MSPQQNKEYLRSLRSKRHRISDASVMRVFRQKDGKHGGCASFSPRRWKCRAATKGDISGACEASDKPSGDIRNACLSSERRQAWRMCILFPPSGEMSRSDKGGYQRKEGGSNPRYGTPYNGFRDRPVRPLRHLSFINLE